MHRIAAFIFSFLFVPLAFAQADVRDSYRLDVSGAQGSLDVRAELHGVLPGELLCLPAFGQRFGEHILSPQAQDAAGSPVAVSFDSAGCFRSDRAELVLTYRLVMDELAAGHAWRASDLSPYHAGGMLAFPGESLFVERGANGSVTTGHATEVHVHRAGQTVTTLSQLSAPLPNLAETQSFLAVDPFALSRSYWAFGVPHVSVAASGRTTLRLAVLGPRDAHVPILEREMLRILDHYANRIPAHTPRDIAVFLFSTPFDADYSHGFARPGGVVLELGQKAAADPYTRRILMAHELFHIYNGEGLRFAPGAYSETAWFREGMTQYVALGALLSESLISRLQLYEWMATGIARAHGHAASKNAHDDAYYLGFFLSMAMESQWNFYQSGHTVEGFWTYLDNTGAWYVLHSNATLEKALETYSAFSFGAFFRQYASGRQELPVEAILRGSGLCIQNKRSLSYSTGIHYAFDPVRAILYIESIDAGSTGEQAGLRRGDVIVPDPGTDWDDRADKRITVVRGTRQMRMRIPPAAVQTSGIAVGPCVQ